MDFNQLHEKLVTRILEGKGIAPSEERHAAFENAGLTEPLSMVIDKVARNANKITKKDMMELKAYGISEDQIFELVICAAVGQATRQYQNALKALSETSSDREGGRHVS